MHRYPLMKVLAIVNNKLSSTGDYATLTRYFLNHYHVEKAQYGPRYTGLIFDYYIIEPKNVLWIKNFLGVE